MSNVIVYSKSWCPYCNRAKKLLESKQVAYIEIDVEREAGKEQEMIERSGGRRTVPQIFIDGQSVGGFDDIAALDAQGRLDPLLKSLRRSEA